jgi:cytochrome c oxidase assembly factor CtaG
MNIVWTPDPIYIVNLILCIIILIFGLVGKSRSGKTYPLYIGIAFGLFGVSHLATLLGLKTALSTILIVIRTCAYLLVAFTLYQTAFKSK